MHVVKLWVIWNMFIDPSSRFSELFMGSPGDLEIVCRSVCVT